MLLSKVQQFLSKLQLVKKCSLFFTAFIVVVLLLNYTDDASKDCLSDEVHKYLIIEEDFNATVGVDLDPSFLRERAWEVNNESEVKNLEEFGPVRPDTPFLVVLARRDAPRLQLLLAALAQVSGVDQLLLLVSHAHYHPAIHRLVQRVDFCMLVQIYFPHSVQLHPATFPGADGSTTRDPMAAERKHHWWWTATYVFEHLDSKLYTSKEAHTDLVVFIDESSYVLPDFAYMLSIAKYSLSYFPEVEVVSMGRPPAEDFDYELLTVEAWRVPLANGLAFTRHTWRKVAALSRRYCEYDDSSWSGSLLHVFGGLPRGRALVLGPQAPRVLRTGALTRGRAALQQLCEAARVRLFPRRVQALVLLDRAGRVLADREAPPRGNGGWTDRRDHYLCYLIHNNLYNIPSTVFS